MDGSDKQWVSQWPGQTPIHFYLPRRTAHYYKCQLMLLLRLSFCSFPDCALLPTSSSPTVLFLFSLFSTFPIPSPSHLRPYHCPSSPSPNVPNSVTPGHPSRSRPNQSPCSSVVSLGRSRSSRLAHPFYPVRAPDGPSCLRPNLFFKATLSVQATPANLDALVAKVRTGPLQCTAQATPTTLL